MLASCVRSSMRESNIQFQIWWNPCRLYRRDVRADHLGARKLVGEIARCESQIRSTVSRRVLGGHNNTYMAQMPDQSHRQKLIFCDTMLGDNYW